MDPDPHPGKEIKVDPDPERGLKWVRIRPNAVDPGESGSETLALLNNFGTTFMRRRKSARKTYLYKCR